MPSAPGKFKDTTSERAYMGARSLMRDGNSDKSLALITRFRIHLVGMYFAAIGPEWDSADQSESDYIHHIDISLSGQRQVLWQGTALHLEPGKVYFLPGNVPVQRRCREACEVIFIKFRCAWLPGVDPLMDWPDRRPLCVGECAPEVWQALLHPDFSRSANAMLELHGRVESWMARVLPDMDALISQHLESHTRFTEVFRVIEENLGAGLRIDDLARVYGTGRDAFSSAFTRATGTTPKDYVKRRLNQEAIGWLINSNLKIKEIADRLGYSDEFYFSRAFQKLNGSPPAKYRGHFRGGQR